MKHTLTLICLLLSAVAVFGQNSNVNVTATSTGTLRAPTNFFGANIDRLTNALNDAGYSTGGGDSTNELSAHMLLVAQELTNKANANGTATTNAFLANDVVTSNILYALISAKLGTNAALFLLSTNDGSGLTNLNASELRSGTVAIARLPGTLGDWSLLNTNLLGSGGDSTNDLNDRLTLVGTELTNKANANGTATTNAFIVADVGTSNAIIAVLNSSVNASSNLANQKIAMTGGTGIGNTLSNLIVIVLYATNGNNYMNPLVTMPNSLVTRLLNTEVDSSLTAGFTNGYAFAVNGVTNMVFRGQSDAAGNLTNIQAQALVGISSFASDSAVTINAAGWTNTLGRNATVYFDGTAMQYTVKNFAGTTVYTTAVATTGAATVNLQPGGGVVIVGTGVAGIATPW